MCPSILAQWCSGDTTVGATLAFKPARDRPWRGQALATASREEARGVDRVRGSRARAKTRRRAAGNQRIGRRSTGIVVAGMHRSGTSAIVRVLNLLGVDVPAALYPARPDNPVGYWEPLQVVEAHEEFLAAIGSSFDDISRLPEGALRGDSARALEDRLVPILESEFADSRQFVVKDPRLCRLVPIWIAALQRFGAIPRFVLPVRNPLAVAASLKLRNEYATTKSLLLWLRHSLEAAAHPRIPSKHRFLRPAAPRLAGIRRQDRARARPCVAADVACGQRGDRAVSLAPGPPPFVRTRRASGAGGVVDWSRRPMRSWPPQLRASSSRGRSRHPPRASSTGLTTPSDPFWLSCVSLSAHRRRRCRSRRPSFQSRWRSWRM